MRASLLFITILFIIGFFTLTAETFPEIESGQNGSNSSQSADFVPVVDRSDDPSDDILNTLTCTEAPNDCPLRQALLMANKADKGQNITFADHYIIKLERPLPAITKNGTKLVAHPGQEIRINGNNQLNSVFHIVAKNVRLEGLSIFGSGASNPNILVNGPAQNVVIARNIIGDDDAPSGNCGQNAQAGAGILIDSDLEIDDTRAWIYGNIIECHQGDGVVIKASSVVVGENENQKAGASERNFIRDNKGVAVRLDNFSGNKIRNNQITNDGTGDILVSNFMNDILENEIN